MIRYALMALPGPGDAVLRRAAERGQAPALVIREREDDFPGCPFPCLTWRDPGEAQRAPLFEGIECLFVAGWERRIESSIVRLFPRGGWNIHPSLLPAYRGHNPYFHVIRDGCGETGVTVHVLTDEIDAGPILLQKRHRLSSRETIGSLWKSLGELSADAAMEALSILSDGPPELRPQPAGTVAPPRAPRVGPKDLELRPDLRVCEAERLVRAANPFFGATLRLPERTVRVFETRSASDPAACGPRLRCSDGELVATVIDVDGLGMISGRTYLELPVARPS